LTDDCFVSQTRSAEMSKSADWKACDRDIKLHVESKCEALIKVPPRAPPPSPLFVLHPSLTEHVY